MQVEDEVRQVHHYSFRMNDLLGKGATGEVYLGENTHNGTKVACKIIDMSKIDNEVTEYLLSNQKRALQILKHPNVIQTVDIFQDRDFCYIFTAFCNEGTLFDNIQNKGRLAENEALQLFDQIVEGYRACAQKGIIHRDIKPANILMHNGKPLISDFGYCQIVGIPKPNTFYNVGSPSYMAPQAFIVNKYSEKSDIWSLGVVLYEMLVGHTFDGGGDMMEVISKLGKQGVPYPEYVTPYCKLIINKCLNLDPAKRISLKNLIDLIKDRKNVDNSDFIKRQSQKQIEQPTAAQIPQMQKAMLQQPMVSPSQLQQQKMLHQRSIKNSTQNQQPVSLPQPQQQPKSQPQPQPQHTMHNVMQRQIQPNYSFTQPQSQSQYQYIRQIPNNPNMAYQQEPNPMERPQQVHIPSRQYMQRGIKSQQFPLNKEQTGEKLTVRAQTHYIPSTTQIDKQNIQNPQQNQQLYEQTLQRQAQGRENFIGPPTTRLLSHHAALEGITNNTPRPVKNDFDGLANQRIDRSESEMLRKVPSLQNTHFRAKGESNSLTVQSSRGFPHKPSQREIMIPTHERFISQPTGNFRPYSIQDGIMRPATTTAISPYSQQRYQPNMMSGKDKLIRSLLVSDVNKQDIPEFTQSPFQKPQFVDFHKMIVKPETNYIPGYHPLGQKIPEVQHVKNLTIQSPVSPVYAVGGGFFDVPPNVPSSRPIVVPSFKKPTARVPNDNRMLTGPPLPPGIQPIQTNPMQPNIIPFCPPENKLNPLLRNPPSLKNGLQTHRLGKNTVPDPRAVNPQLNPQFRPVR